MNKKVIGMFLALGLLFGAVGCSSQNNVLTTTQLETTNAAILSSINISSGKTQSVGEASTFIGLGDDITVEGDGVTVDNKKVTITSAGTYSIRGDLTDGQIIVDAGDEDKVYIILNGVNITCSNSAPIYIKNSDKTIISLADNTQNYIQDGENYIFEDGATDEPNAAIFSKADLIFIGDGSLDITANYNNGITSKDDLKIQSGNITVKSKADGIKGKDSVVITNGNVTVNSGEDGIKSSNDEDSEKGYVLIESGKINITAVQDGIQAETNALIKDGDITINAGGGSKNGANKNDNGMPMPGMMRSDNVSTTETTKTEDTVSAKAIKAKVNIVTEGGTFNIDSSDDSMHSDNNLVINAGTFNLASGDDGMHADSTLTINNGDINITKSYEGIESKTITINDGNINVISSDDGVNASDSSESSESNNSPSMNGRPGQNNMESSGNGMINLNGGYVNVNASGDGIDANGSIKMTGGTVIVNGPTNDGNGALDYDGSFEATGGTLIAAGSSGMAQAPSSSSTQNSVKVTLSNQTANTLVRIENEAGEEVVTFTPLKQYSSVVVSSPNLKTGSTYKVYVGGSSTGTVTNGLYSDGVYTKGKEIGSFTVSSSVIEVTQEGVTVTNRMGDPRGQGGAGMPGDQGNMGNPQGMKGSRQ
jgi:hypothetical protein